MKKLKTILAILVLLIFAAALGYAVFARSGDLPPLSGLFTKMASHEPADDSSEETPEPEPELPRTVSINGKSFPADCAVVELDGTIEPDELIAGLKLLDAPEEVILDTSEYSPAQQRKILSALPDVRFSWPVSVGDRSYPSLTESLELTCADAGEFAQIAESADLLRNVRCIELGENTYTPEELSPLTSAWDKVEISCLVDAFGMTFPSDTEELDISGIKVTDTSVFDSLIPVLYNVKKVIMCDCGIADEDMDALNHRYDGVRFVWTVYISWHYPIRTDRTYFCVSDVPENGYVAYGLTDENLYPLRYCTDMEALDLGHIKLTNIDFLYSMPKLKYLVLVTNLCTDITAIGSLKELVFLEYFHNTIDDLTPLLDCPKLEYLNLGYSEGFDPAPLYEMKDLKMLWLPGVRLTDEEKDALASALPDTEVYTPVFDEKGSTGGGWRDSDVYKQMRDAIHMFYLAA